MVQRPIKTSVFFLKWEVPPGQGLPWTHNLRPQTAVSSTCICSHTEDMGWDGEAEPVREEKTNKLYRVWSLRASANQRLVSGCTCWINDLPWQEIPPAILILIRLQGSGKNKNTSVIMTGSFQSHGKQLFASTGIKEPREDGEEDVQNAHRFS